MKKNELKQEIMYFGLSFLVVIFTLKLFYYHESIWKIVKLTVGIYYLFLIPGFIFMLKLKDKLNVLTRLILGLGLGLGLEAIIVYYLNILFNVPVTPYYLIYPLITGGIALILLIKSKK